MLKPLRLIGYAILAGLLATGCETPIEIDLPEHRQVAVIEGWIENGQPAIVAMSISRPYYSTTSMDSILKSIQTNAKVTVTDSNTGESEQLTLGKTNDHIYGVLGKAYIGKSLKGVPGHTYLLHVENNGSHYDASTKIPQHGVRLDSLYFSRKGRSFIRILFTDHAGEFNCYRFLTKVKGQEPTFTQVYIGTFDDLTFDGKQLNFELTRMPYSNLLGIEYKTLEDLKNATMFKRGDVVYVKSTTTDPATKDFWFALQMDRAMTNNMIVSIWSGYHARYDTIVCR